MFQEPHPGGPSSEIWNQEVSVGGADVDGEPAAAALAVAPQGVSTVRNVPTLGAASNSYTVSAGKSMRILGRVPQRRAVTIIASALGRINVDQGMLDGGVGMRLPADVPITFESANEIWFRSETAAEVSFWAEIDLG